MSIVDFFKNNKMKTLIHPTIVQGQTQYTNVLLIDKCVPSYEIFINSVNSSTFPIIYSSLSSKSEILTLLDANFKSISKIGFCFYFSSKKTNMFLKLKPLFNNIEVEPYSEDVKFTIDIINKFQVKSVDFLACNTLNYANWVNFYKVLEQQTGVIVGASNNKTGNIKYGGDWIMESTSKDVEFIYFNKNIEYYKYLLDDQIWEFNVAGKGSSNIDFYENYMYYMYSRGAGEYKIMQININDGTVNNPEWGPPSEILYGPRSCIGHNGYLYLSTLFNIIKINLTNPESDYIVWHSFDQDESSFFENNIPPSFAPSSMAISGNYLYGINSVTGIIYKMSLINPESDFNLNWIRTKNLEFYNPYEDSIYVPYIVISGDYLYALSSRDGVISKISLINPELDYTADWKTITSFELSYSHGIATSGNYLYVLTIDPFTGDGLISKISLTNPDLDYNANWLSVSGAVNIKIHNDYLYINYGKEVRKVSLDKKEDVKIPTNNITFDNNAIFRRQPLNYNQSPFVMSFHRYGVLNGVRPTPQQFAPMQTQPNMEDKVNARHEFWRTTPSAKDKIGQLNKYIPVASSSTITSNRKRNAIGRSSYYSKSGDFSTKNYNTNDSKTAIRMSRSGGSVGPKKKGAI
jgi:hypothetical protein